MSIKEDNEITVKIKCELNEFYNVLEKNGFRPVKEFSMDDAYFVPEILNLEEMNTRDILSKAVLVRDIRYKNPDIIKKMITFKIKKFDDFGNILNQESINCDVNKIEDAKKLLSAIGYKEIMRIEEDDIVYEKDNFQLAVKNVKNGEKLAEIEIDTKYNKELDTIQRLIKKVNELELPIYTDNYFVKKAELELDKILKR